MNSFINKNIFKKLFFSILVILLFLLISNVNYWFYNTNINLTNNASKNKRKSIYNKQKSIFLEYNKKILLDNDVNKL